MNAPMFDWINKPHADYVLAAYAVAAIALIGLALLSWRENRARAKEWQSLSESDKKDN